MKIYRASDMIRGVLPRMLSGTPNALFDLSPLDFWAGVRVSYEGVEDAVDALLQRVTQSPVDAVP